MDKKYEALKLENQLCFPLYAASRDVIKQYKTSLDNLDLTYTQYIVMLVLWERKQITTKEMGRILHLDSGTLTPLLKKMEGKGLVSRKRSEFDERAEILKHDDECRQYRAKRQFCGRCALFVECLHKMPPCCRPRWVQRIF